MKSTNPFDKILDKKKRDLEEAMDAEIEKNGWKVETVYEWKE